MIPDIVNAIADCKLFKGIVYPEVHSVIQQADLRAVRFVRGEIHTMCNEPCCYFDIVVSGELVVRMMGDSGRMMEVLKLERGDVVAPCYLFATDRTVPASIEASRDSMIVRMSLSSLRSLIDADSRIRWNFLQVVSDTAVYMVRRIEFLSLKTVREKIATYLRTEAKKQHSHTITMTESRQRIANFFAIQKFSLLRCLADLSSKGIISVGKKTITILDFSRL